MKKIVLAFLLFSTSLFAQQGGETFYSKEFRWTIKIPQGFENVDPAEWDKVQNKGADLLEEVYKEDMSEALVVNKSILVIKSGMVNYMEACKQPFDLAVDGDFEESCKFVSNAIVDALKQQIPGSESKTVFSHEIVGGKKFHKAYTEFKYPNGMIFYIHTYSILFGKIDFTVNVMYLSKSEGEKMVEAFKTSVFQ